MDSRVLTILCDPETQEPLELEADALLNARSGRRYPVCDGVPDFIDSISGQNKKYQELYDRIAVFYDLGETVYRIVKRADHFRKGLYG